MSETVFKLASQLKALAHSTVDAAWARSEAAHAARAAEPGCSCCEIPETSCPSRIAGVVRWTVGRGSGAEAVIQVRNTGAQARNFAFEVSPLAGVAVGSARLELSADAAMLAPGQTALLSVQLVDSTALSPCQDYRAEVRIRGAWEQAVKFECHVVRDAYDECSLSQSDSLAGKALYPKWNEPGIAWKIVRGMRPTATLSVHNTGKSARVFSIEPSALAGPRAAGASLTVAPETLQLGPGERRVVQLELLGSSSLSAAQTYRGELLVRGFHEQRLPVRCAIEADASGYVEIDQGEAPTRRRAHRWYDHFQCTQSCTQR